MQNGKTAPAVSLSIVTTMYRSAPYIAEFHERASREARAIAGDRYEIVFVDDGSPDDSLVLALDLHERDAHVRVVELSRNFGHHKALMTGLRHARGELVFLIDSDLEEEPELLSAFYEELRRNPELDVVYGVQAKRKGSLFERAAGRVHYWILNSIWDVHLPEDVIVGRLMRRPYVDRLIEHSESEMVISGIWQSTGFRQKALTVRKHSLSPTTYNLRAKINLMTRSVTAFSTKPLDLVAIAGALLLPGSILASIVFVAASLAAGRPIGELDVLLMSCWIAAGVLAFGVGMVALYLGTTHREVKRRPFTIVRAVHERHVLPPLEAHAKDAQEVLP